jgi:penicillin-binding protein 1A
MQAIASHIFTNQISLLKQQFSKDIDGAFISLHSTTGAIKALIGGFDFGTSTFNRALQSKRQIGSTIKPLIYAAALASGKSFDDIECDEPIHLTCNGKTWKPRNYNRQFAGNMSLAYALSHSNNIIAIKTLLAVGADKVVDLAKHAGIIGPFHTYPSLALGCIDATLQEIVGMFNIFINKGMYVQPYLIEYVKDQWGKKVWRHEPLHKKVLDAHIAGQVAHILQDNIERFFITSPQNKLIVPAISKTGTTNDSRTCWYVGSIPEYTTAVYIGCDDNRSMGKDVFPRKTSFPIWLRFNQKITAYLKFSPGCSKHLHETSYPQSVL